MIGTLGKAIKLEYVVNPATHRTVIIPMDHGVTVGPVKGLEDLPRMVNLVALGGADAVVGHMGLALHGHRGYGKRISLILHLSASTELGPDPNHKVLVNSVERAIKMGANAVSVHINIGAEDEADMLRDLGMISGICLDWGMPLLAMMYARGKDIQGDKQKDVEVLKIATRVAMELGVDMIKTPYTGDPKTFEEIVRGCAPVPVVIAGGSKTTDEEALQQIKGAIQVGGAGVSIGRKVFQHERPARMTAAICHLVHENGTVDEALELLDVPIEGE